MNTSRYQYVLYVTKQIKGFVTYMIAASIVRTLCKLCQAVLFIVSVALLIGILSNNIAWIKNGAVLLFVLILAKVVLSYLDTYVSHDMSFKILTRLREVLYDKIDEIAPGGIEGRATSDFVTAIVSDINVFEWFYAHVLIEWIGTIFTLAVLGIVLIQYSVVAFLVVLLAILLMVFIPQLTVSKAEEKGYVLKQLFGRLNGVITDGIQGIKDVLGYRWEKTFFAQVEQATEEYAQTQLQYSLRSSDERQSIGLITVLAIALAVVSMLMQGSSNVVGDVLMVFAFAFTMLQCVESTLSEGTNYGFVFGAAKRVVDILQIKAPVLDAGTLDASEVEAYGIPGRLVFEDVSFSYHKDDKTILDHVSFSIRTGGITAIVGASGGGKSTIARLIQRYWDVCDGGILLNDIDIRDIKLVELRKLITLVPQEIYLFNGTIEDNLHLIKPQASFEEIKQAAHLARADGFISRLEDGYNTMVGENGVLLSGGEKQRLALAQAFLRDAPVLILDEATSALDVENEKYINHVLQQLKQDRMIILIAHRLSTIQAADRIIFLKNGCIQQVGTYQELIVSNQQFNDLVQGVQY